VTDQCCLGVVHTGKQIVDIFKQHASVLDTKVNQTKTALRVQPTLRLPGHEAIPNRASG
jgi:hypothetical protein